VRRAVEVYVVYALRIKCQLQLILMPMLTDSRAKSTCEEYTARCGNKGKLLTD